MSELQLLEKRIKASAIQEFVVAIAIVVLAAISFAGAIAERRVFVGLVGALLLFGAWVMFQAGRRLWPATESALYKALSTDSRDIGWVHLTIGRTNSVKVYFLDGQIVSLYANKQDCATLLRFIHQRAPHAVFGYGTKEQLEYHRRVKAKRSEVGPEGHRPS